MGEVGRHPYPRPTGHFQVSASKKQRQQAEEGGWHGGSPCGHVCFERQDT
jgi:hypothetical protein